MITDPLSPFVKINDMYIQPVYTSKLVNNTIVREICEYALFIKISTTQCRNVFTSAILQISSGPCTVYPSGILSPTVMYCLHNPTTNLNFNLCESLPIIQKLKQSYHKDCLIKQALVI